MQITNAILALFFAIQFVNASMEELTQIPDSKDVKEIFKFERVLRGGGGATNIIATRRVSKVHPSWSSIKVALDDCKGSDEYGCASFELTDAEKSGQITINAPAIDASYSIKLDINVKYYVPFSASSSCKICGEPCEINIPMAKPQMIEMPACPVQLAQGDVRFTIPKLPLKKLFAGMTIASKIVMKKGNQVMGQIDVDAVTK